MSSQNIKSFYYFLPSLMNCSYKKLEHFGLSARVAANCQNCVTSEVERNALYVLFISGI